LQVFLNYAKAVTAGINGKIAAVIFGAGKKNAEAKS